MSEKEKSPQYKIALANLTEEERKQIKRDERSDTNRATFDTNIPNVDEKRKLEAMQKGALIADEIQRQGGTIPMDGLNEVGQPVTTLGMTPKEKFFAQGRLNDKQQLGGFKSFGDKSAFEAKNAVRRLQGMEPLEAPLSADKQFLVDLEKSASFGTESALTGQKGQARAFEAGVRAGYTPEQTRKFISDTAARITGVVDKQKEQTTETPKSPAKLPFFEQVYEQFRGPAPTTTTSAAPQTTTTPKSPAQPPLFERTYEQFKVPTPASPPPPATPPVNPQNMTTAEGVLAAGMRGSLGGVPTPVLRDATSEAKNLLAPLAQTAGFFKAAEQLDYILGRKRNQK
jgi:hypothetical protein